jgi:predicted alpha/beta superfamily hydrolase
MHHTGMGIRPATGNVVGDIRVIAGVVGPEPGNRRDLQVYLPPSYRTSGRHYPVIYMHDGQNLFDAATSFAGEWEVDETMERLAPRGIESIVVAIPNAGESRADEYSPFRQPRVGGGRGDQYLDFIVHTVKPTVDQRFRTRLEPTHTGIMGSSLGGLISLYGFFRFPDVFGFAGAMSPALWFGRRRIFETIAPCRWTGRIYLDVGTAEGRALVRDVRLMSRMLRERTDRPRLNVRVVVDRGARHHESAWAARFEQAVRFLLPKPPADLHW